MISRHNDTDVPYTAQQMYALVADIETYPDFLPWCAALRVVSRDLTEGAGTISADMVVAYKVFRERFRSNVMLDPINNIINAHYTDGPFETLRTEWRFTDKETGGSTIDFYIEFQFKNVLLQSTARMVFEKAFARMSEAFVRRAHEIYASRDSRQSSSPLSNN